MRIVSYFFILIIAIFGMTFAALNSENVVLNYYVGQVSFPLSLILVLVFAGGCMIGILVGIWLLFKSKMQVYRMRQRLSLAEREIENLRAIPLQDKV